MHGADRPLGQVPGMGSGTGALAGPSHSGVAAWIRTDEQRGRKSTPTRIRKLTSDMNSTSGMSSRLDRGGRITSCSFRLTRNSSGMMRSSLPIRPSSTTSSSSVNRLVLPPTGCTTPPRFHRSTAVPPEARCSVQGNHCGEPGGDRATGRHTPGVIEPRTLRASTVARWRIYPGVLRLLDADGVVVYYGERLPRYPSLRGSQPEDSSTATATTPTTVTTAAAAAGTTVVAKPNPRRSVPSPATPR